MIEMMLTIEILSRFKFILLLIIFSLLHSCNNETNTCSNKPKIAFKDLSFVYYEIDLENRPTIIESVCLEKPSEKYRLDIDYKIKPFEKKYADSLINAVVSELADINIEVTTEEDTLIYHFRHPMHYAVTNRIITFQQGGLSKMKGKELKFEITNNSCSTKGVYLLIKEELIPSL